MRNKLFLSAAFAAVASVSQADIVLNQIPLVETPSHPLFASQDFEPANSIFDVNFIEDFTVNANQTLVTQVKAIMGGFSGFDSPAEWALVSGFRVEIYTSVAAGAANLTGNAGSQLVGSGSASIVNQGWTSNNSTMRLITLPVNIVLPGAGTYWIGVMGVMDLGANVNQIGVANNTVVSGGDNAFFVNPAGGFGLPGNNQMPNPPQNAAYQVDAQAVPEPGTMIALGLGVSALLARRRRKVA